jgi:hypothetical protein
MQANQLSKTKPTTHNHDDPQIPQPDLRFAREKQQTEKQRGKTPNAKQKTQKDLP